MDKNALKKYAVWARRELISRVSQKALQYGISEKDCGESNVDSVNGRVLSPNEKSQRNSLIEKIKSVGYQEAMEEAAYTWFNRFTALRYMEVNGYLPSHVRVFTDESNNFKPQIIDEAIHLDIEGLDMDKVYTYKEANDTEELYKYLLIIQCNAFGEILPGMFSGITDFTILLFPDNILREGSVLDQMISVIPEEDWKDQVQIIGWLYQYYNSEKKDSVFEAMKKKVKVSKENIAAATQLFTPDWIVRYMVENSLGRLWVDGHADTSARSEWKYYLDEAEQTAEVQAQLAEIRAGRKDLTPEQIRFIDPCMGSGHILVYAFDVLMQIYLSCGYTERDAAQNIVRNNLWGLDLDKRAYQLAYFAVMMKARQYDRRFLTRGIKPNLSHFQDLPQVETGDLEEPLRSFVAQFENADTYGSLISVNGDYAEEELHSIYINPESMEHLMQLYKILSQRYDVVCTNPPYMGAGNMNGTLKDYINAKFADYKSDFFSAFVIRCTQFAKHDGYLGFLTPYVWMFIQSYEALRKELYSNRTIETLIQFEYSAFEEATVPICTFAFRNNHIPNKNGCYLRLTDFRGGMEVQRQKALEAISNHNCGFYFESQTDNFSKIPGAPVAYWWGNYKIFDADKLCDYYESAGRNKTHNNNLYVRNWWEIKDVIRWQPYANGGEFRRWAGNDYDLVDWSISAKENYASHGGLYNQKYNGKRGVCWNLITSYKNGFRLKVATHHYSSAAPTIITKSNDYDYYLLAFLNCIVAENLLKIYNPTLNTTVGDVLGLPFIIEEQEKIETISKENIKISKSDWDSFETSWDFKEHPFVKWSKELWDATAIGAAMQHYYGGHPKAGCPLELCYLLWQGECNDRRAKLKSNEEELNRIFIEIYGLQDELTPDVDDKDITVRAADLQRDMRSFVSYAVGCMFGRYSLDTEGLAYAGGEWDESKYRTFSADKDNIIPICDNEYFDDDLTGLFVQFVKTVFGEETLEDNLRFIADALGGKSNPRAVIRNYFLNSFYADHCKTYQKRPIYWLFDSGKKNGFKALIYMHRYQPDTIARLRTDYVHEQQSRYRTANADIEKRISGASGSEAVKLTKELEKLNAQADELITYEEMIHHLADQMIKIDLNDGVKKNYEIFKDVLTKIK